MKQFSDLLEALVLTPSRNAKLRLLTDYLAHIPDPDRGYGIAAIAGTLELDSIKPAMLRALISERIDPELFALSYDYVGDLAETIALIWPEHERQNQDDLSLGHIVETLQKTSRKDTPKLIEAWLNQCSSSARYGLLKLVTGGMRIGVSARLAKQALADFGNQDVSEIEELWPGQEPPYSALMAWLSGKSDKPTQKGFAPFRPVMLAHPAAEKDLAEITPQTHSAEWKWDGIRIQAVRENGETRLYSRTGDDIAKAFPDLADAMTVEGALDGELLVGWPDADNLRIGSFGDLQQRLNRKTVSKAKLKSHPAIMRCYDILHDGTEDVRDLPLIDRRKKLKTLIGQLPENRFDLSHHVDFESLDDLANLRANPPHPVIEGLMLKRHDSPYMMGRVRGPWFKWKRDPFLVDVVLMYAQRGHGKRSSFYSDYTFGVWDGDPQKSASLVPVGKAYSGFTDEELKRIDKYVRDNTIDRFGPVRSVTAKPDFGLVLEVAFEGLNRSSRHKSGVAMRFPRISKLRWDKPAHEADQLATLQAMLD